MLQHQKSIEDPLVSTTSRYCIDFLSATRGDVRTSENLSRYHRSHFCVVWNKLILNIFSIIEIVVHNTSIPLLAISTDGSLLAIGRRPYRMTIKMPLLTLPQFQDAYRRLCNLRRTRISEIYPECVVSHHWSAKRHQRYRETCCFVPRLESGRESM